ncbi:hypothetical protein BDV06DRAFT_200777 [Aspergillus oleicola]
MASFLTMALYITMICPAMSQVHICRPSSTTYCPKTSHLHVLHAYTRPTRKTVTALSNIAAQPVGHGRIIFVNNEPEGPCSRHHAIEFSSLDMEGSIWSSGEGSYGSTMLLLPILLKSGNFLYRCVL